MASGERPHSAFGIARRGSDALDGAELGGARARVRGAFGLGRGDGPAQEAADRGLGALLLAGLYALFNTTIMPTVTKKVTDLFNYKGK